MDPVHAVLDSLTRDPGDDTAWLALADALEEKDDPRADATRLSLWLRRRLDDPNHATWEHRLRELVEQGVRVCLPEKSVSLGKRVKLSLVLAPPGSFRMGSEQAQAFDEWPQHRVTLTKGFYLGVHPVTQSQWRAVMGGNPSTFKRNNRPVENVSWEDCQEFCRKLGEREGKRYRLPTEAEWEYACLAGATTEYCSGNGLEAMRKVGWCSYDRAIQTAMVTKPVGQFQPNAWGLFDMHGNVWEWCQDGKRSYHSRDIEDPHGPEEKEVGHMLRGGCWHNDPSSCRAVARQRFEPSYRSNSVGCRVVLCLD